MQEFLDFLLPISIGVIMLGIGMELTTKDFERVFIEPKAILFGLFGQLVIMVVIAFGVAAIFPLDPIHRLGIVLIAACPGGTSSNIVSYMLKGRVALSVSITAFNSFLIVFTIPIVLNLAFSLFWTSSQEQNIDISPIYNTFMEVGLTILLPVLLGIFIRQYFPIFADRVKKPLRYILPTILFSVFLLVLINEQKSGEKEIADYWELILPAILLNVLVMFVGFFLSGAIGINHQGKYTIAIEMGLQNSVLAIYLANNVLKIDGLSLIAVLYGSFSFFSTFIIAYIMKNYMEKKNLT